MLAVGALRGVPPLHVAPSLGWFDGHRPIRDLRRELLDGHYLQHDLGRDSHGKAITQ